MKKSILGILCALTLTALVSCGGNATKSVEKPSANDSPQAASDVKLPAMKADPNVYPLFSFLYSGGEENGAKYNLYTWNGCKIYSITNTADGYNGDPIYWKVKLGTGIDWFGWGIHAKEPGNRDMKGFENGHLRFGLRASPGSTPIKILIKHGYATESWMEVTPALGWATDGKWHDIALPLKDFMPKIKFGVVNIQFAMSQQIAPPKGGSEYDIAEIAWTKD